MRTNFQKISASFTMSGECPSCHKKVRRSRTFWQTVNPWNKNSDGSVKTESEVYASVVAEGEVWQPDFTHARCA